MSERTDINPDDLEEYIDEVIEEKIKYLKTYDAVVMNNIDPENEGKVLVMVHDLGWATPDLWAWASPEFPMRGGWIIPAIGDEIKIYFDKGNVEEMVYRGYIYFDVLNPAPESLFSKGVIFKTKTQLIQMTYDDALGKFEIVVGTAGLHKVTIDITQGIIITDGVNEVSLKATGIELKTGDASAWVPCIIGNCIFSGAPHGGTPAGIIKLKGA